MDSKGLLTGNELVKKIAAIRASTIKLTGGYNMSESSEDLSTLELKKKTTKKSKKEWISEAEYIDSESLFTE